MYYLGRQDPNDGYINGESWHIVGPDAWTATAFFSTWKEAKEYLDFKNKQNQDPNERLNQLFNEIDNIIEQNPQFVEEVDHEQFKRIEKLVEDVDIDVLSSDRLRELAEELVKVERLLWKEKSTLVTNSTLLKGGVILELYGDLNKIASEIEKEEKEVEMNCDHCIHGYSESGDRRACGFLLQVGETKFIKNGHIDEPCPLNEQTEDLITRLKNASLHKEGGKVGKTNNDF